MRWLSIFKIVADNKVDDVSKKLSELEREKEGYRSQLEAAKEKIERENLDEQIELSHLLVRIEESKQRECDLKQQIGQLE